jgi:DNA-binding transcriptional MerR regulator
MLKYLTAGDNMEKEYFKIEDVATKTGLTKRAIRYYEDIELIKPVRTESSYRLYTEEDIDKIIRIKELKHSIGFSLNEVKDIFDLELNLIDIFKGKKQDEKLVNGAIKTLESQLKLIEEKEQTLGRVKNKYMEVLQKLKLIDYSR